MELVYGPSSENKPEWLAARRQTITATDVARLAGSNNWAGLKSEKAGNVAFTGNKYTAHGVEREPIIAARLKESGWKHNQHLLFHPEHPKFSATPDLLHDSWNMVGDIKTCLAKGDLKDWTPPQKYTDQVLWQMLITGAEAGMLFVEFYDDANGMFWPLPMLEDYEVKRDEQRISELVILAHKFLDAPIDELDMMLADYARTEEHFKHAQAALDEEKARIRKVVEMREFPFKHVSDVGSVSFSQSKDRMTINYKALFADHPELQHLAEEYTEVKQGVKTLRITAKENNDEVQS